MKVTSWSQPITLKESDLNRLKYVIDSFQGVFEKTVLKGKYIKESDCFTLEIKQCGGGCE